MSIPLARIGVVAHVLVGRGRPEQDFSGPFAARHCAGDHPTPVNCGLDDFRRNAVVMRRGHGECHKAPRVVQTRQKLFEYF